MFSHIVYDSCVVSQCLMLAQHALIIASVKGAVSMQLCS